MAQDGAGPDAEAFDAPPTAEGPGSEAGPPGSRTERERELLAASMVLAVVAGVLGIPITFIALGAGSIAYVVGQEGALPPLLLAWIALAAGLAAFAAVLAGALVRSSPQGAGTTMFLAAVVGGLAGGLLWLIPAALLFVAGVLARLGNRRTWQ